MKELDSIKSALMGEKISVKTLNDVKECNKKWEKQRERVGLNSLTQKDRITQLEINFAKMIGDVKEVNKNIKTIFILFAFQIFIDALILLALIKVK